MSIINDILNFNFRDIIQDKVLSSKSFREFTKDPVHLICLGKTALDDYQQLKEFKISIKSKFIISNIESNNLDYYKSSHPQLTDESIIIGDKLVNFISKINDNEKVLIYISGGASSMVEVLKDNINMKDYSKQLEGMIAKGEEITKLNDFRIYNSKIKGGGLLKLLAKQKVFSLINCDIPNGDYRYVGSGPTFFYKHKNYDFLVCISPEDFKKVLPNIRIKNISGSLESVSEGIITDFINNNEHFSYGEITINVPTYSNGMGGRNTHFVAHMANELFFNSTFSDEFKRKIHIFSYASDGQDGSGKCFGALTTYDSFSQHGHKDVENALKSFNTFSLFEKSNNLLFSYNKIVNICDIRGIFISD